MSDAHLQVVFDGPALQNGEMDVRDLAPALLAFGELCERTNELVNGDKSKIEVKIKANFEKASFHVDIHLVQTWAQHMMEMLSTTPPSEILALLLILGIGKQATVGVIQLFKQSKGKRVDGVALPDGNIQITINNTTINVAPEVVRVHNDSQIQRAMREQVAPLALPGVEVFKIRLDGGTGEEITKQDYQEIIDIEPDLVEEADSTEIKPFPIEVSFVSVRYEGTAEWQFRMGKNREGGKVDKGHVLDREFTDEVRAQRILIGPKDIFNVQMGGKLVRDSRGEWTPKWDIVAVGEKVPGSPDPAPQQTNLFVSDEPQLESETKILKKRP